MMFKDFLKDRMPIKSQAKYVEFGFGQVEPNHLSAQRTGQIYAQLPAAPAINVLEQGQFVKYDYAANGNGIGEVNFTGKGEWMMVYNEIKLYRNHPDGSKQWDCEFAMVKDDYQARIYSPYDYEAPELEYHNAMYLNGKDEKGNTSITVNRAITLNADGKTVDVAGTRINVEEKEGKVVFTYNGEEYELVNGTAENVPVTYAYDDVTKDVEDIYEWGFTNDPWKKLGIAREKKMPAGTSMVPRVFKTNVGDIMTTNTINETTLAIGDLLTPGATDGILAKAGADAADMQWQVVKLYDMPDGQKAAKVMRIK
jgi:archaellin